MTTTQLIPEEIEKAFIGAGLEILDAVCLYRLHKESLQGGEDLNEIECERWNVRYRFDRASDHRALVDYHPEGSRAIIIDGQTVREWAQEARAKAAASVNYEYPTGLHRTDERRKG